MKTVLLIDDEKEIRTVIRWELEEVGLKTVEASCLQEAKDLLNSLKKEDQPNLIITDLRMPKGSGLEFVKYFRTRYGSETPILLVTAQSDFDEKEGLSSGANVVLKKPFDFPALVKLTTEFLEKRKIA